MSGDCIRTKQVTVTIQENGIIRNEKGRFLGRLDNEIEFDGEHMPPKKVKKVCKDCGSEDVWKDAMADWDTEKQKWVLRGTNQAEFCENCEGETHIVDEPC